MFMICLPVFLPDPSYLPPCQSLESLSFSLSPSEQTGKCLRSIFRLTALANHTSSLKLTVIMAPEGALHYITEDYCVLIPAETSTSPLI